MDIIQMGRKAFKCTGLREAADEFREKPKKKAAEENDFGPDLKVIRDRAFIEMTNGRINGVRVEAWSAEGVEIGNQAGAGGGTWI